MLTKNAIGNLSNRYRAVLQNCRLLNTLGTLVLAGTMLTASYANAASYIDTVKAYDPATGVAALITAYNEDGYSIVEGGDATTSKVSFWLKLDPSDSTKITTFYVLKDGESTTATALDDDVYDQSHVGEVATEKVTISGNEYTVGGGLYIDSNISADITADFIANSATYYGGAIYNAGSIGNITNSNFIANTAKYGGAIYNAENATIGDITGSAFLANKATGFGGAIYNAGSMGTIENSTFIGNTAVSGGGAISNSSANSTIGAIENATFIGNTATSPYSYAGNGGAISNSGTITNGITNSTFIGNSANNGGAIYTRNDLTFNADNGDLVFTDNKAGGNFNAIYVNGSDKTLTFNLAGTGNIYMSDGISGNIAYTVNITGDDASTGAFYLNDAMDNNGTVNVNDTTLTLGSYTHNNGETTVGGINGTATINEGGTLKVDARGQTASVSNLTLNEGTLTIENGTLDLSGAGKNLEFIGTSNTINVGVNGTLKAEFSMLGKLDSSAYTFAKTDSSDNALNYTFSNTAGMLIFEGKDEQGTPNKVINITTDDYKTLMGNIKDTLVDDDGSNKKSYTGSVLVDGVTWSGLTLLDSVEANAVIDTVVSGGTTTFTGDASVSGITGGDSTIGRNASLTLTGTMGGVDVALFDSGTLNNEGTLNIGENNNKPLLFNGNLSTSGTTNVNQKTTFTGTTTVLAGTLNVNAAGTTFDAATLSGGTISVSSDDANTPSSAVFASLTKGIKAGTLYSENAYVQVMDGLGDGLNHYVGKGGVLNAGAALAQADFEAMTKAMGLTTTAVDGGGFISAVNAIFVHNTGKTLDMSTGKLIVDSGVNSIGFVGGSTPSDVRFGANSALIVNTANLGTNAVIDGGSLVSVTVDSTSKLGLLGVKTGEYTILDAFRAPLGATIGWAEDKVYVLNPLYEVDGVSDTNGSYTVTVGKVSADIAFDGVMDENLSSALDSYTPNTNPFLDKALDISTMDKATIAKSIEGATKTAVVSGLGAALGHVGTASVGNIEKRNGSAQVFSENDTRPMLAMAGDGVILPVDKAQEGFGLWFMPMYKRSSADGFESGNYKYGYDTDIYGATLGADYTFASSLRLGLAFNVGTGDSESTGDFDTTKNDFDYFGLTAYGNMRFGKLALSADLGYTASSNDIDQDNTFGHLSADADASLLSFGMKGEYELSFDSFNLTPYAGIRVNYYNIDSFDTKHQGTTTASTAESDYTLVEFPVGLTFDTTLQSGGWDITPSLGLGVKFAAGDLDMDQKVRYTGAQSAVLTSEVADAVTFQAALGLDMTKDAYSLGLAYTLDLSENVQSHGVQVNLRYEF